MPSILCFIFFLSGMSALIFEALWFRLAGLTFGSSVWASSLVLSSFMGGLALGNGFAARWGWRIRSHVRVYAGLELIIGCSGLSLVLLFPHFNVLFAPLFRPLLDELIALNAARFALAFGLMCIPATAMGATLPILVKALVTWDAGFGRALGRLYGWNTLGAVFGALVGDLALYRWVGLHGAGIVAFTINVTAAALAFSIRNAFSWTSTAPQTGADRLSWWRRADGVRMLCAAFLAGGVLLALEVVWFRFMLLFVHGIGLSFATMLAVVLLGIGLGGMLAAAWIHHAPRAFDWLPQLALISSVLVILLYAFFDVGNPEALVRQTAVFSRTLWRTLRLMFPVSLISGILFTFMGAKLKELLGEETRTAGMLTIANTLGAMLGALTAGFILLPQLGMEKAFLACALVYVVIALLVLIDRRPWQSFGWKWSFWFLSAACALLVAIFPHGLMENHYLKIVLKRFTHPGEPIEVLSVKEGLSETVILTGHRFAGVPLRYRLITNGHSMSGVNVNSDRYMKAYVFLPVAFHPAPKTALLISYGVGNTAKALVETASLERIDIVDISREILDLSSIIFPDEMENPLRDRRVHVHVEDGRYFLQTTELRFDIITAEPPPPKYAGIVNLYTREFFELARTRLTDEGMITYWLPLLNLLESDAHAIMRAFWDVFPDFTLWTGSSYEWMMAGSRGLSTVKSAEAFSQQWRDEAVVDDLVATGFETPGFLGATFLADADQLKSILEPVLPLRDLYPMRLSQQFLKRQDWIWGAAWMDTERCRRQFENSAWIRRFWPEPLRDDVIRCFAFQPIVNRFLETRRAKKEWRLVELAPVIRHTSYRFLVLWMNDVTQRMVDAARTARTAGLSSWEIDFVAYVDAWADRDFQKADQALAALTRDPEHGRDFLEDRVFGLCLAGDLESAREVFREWSTRTGKPGGEAAFQEWMAGIFGSDLPIIAKPD